MTSASDSPDVVVVGAGVIGLATAFELLRAGRSVTVLERGTLGRGGASWAAGGILSPLDPADVDPALLPWIRESLAGYAQWCAAIQEAGGIDPEYATSGLQVLPPADEAEWRRLAGELGLRLSPFSHGWLLPQIGQVRSPRLLAGLAAAVRARGGRIVEQAPVDRLVGRARVEAVEAAGRRYPSGAVVLATGAWTGSMAPRTGIQPVRGEMLQFEGRPGELPHLLLRDHMYVIPRRDGTIVAGSTLEPAGFDDTPTPAGREAILAAVRHMAPRIARRKVAAHWAGLRPAPMGPTPRVEAVEGREGLYLNAGHYRLGITLAPGSARRVVALIEAG